MSLVSDHRTGSRQRMRPSNLRHALPALEQSAYHVHAIVSQRSLTLHERIDDPSDPTRGIDRLDVSLDQLPDLLRDLRRCETEREGFGGVEVEEEEDEDDGEDHVEFVFRVDAVGVFGRLQREGEDVGCEVGMGEIADAVLRS